MDAQMATDRMYSKVYRMYLSSVKSPSTQLRGGLAVGPIGDFRRVSGPSLNCHG